MKAVVCKSYGPPENLTLEEVADPAPVRGQVLIDVYAAGLNFPDVLQIAGKYQFQPPFPFTPGSEFAGIITEVGMGVGGVKPGDRVMALTGTGAMAERAVVDASSVEVIPDDDGLRYRRGLGNRVWHVVSCARATCPIAAGGELARLGSQRRRGIGGS